MRCSKRRHREPERCSSSRRSFSRAQTLLSDCSYHLAVTAKPTLSKMPATSGTLNLAASKQRFHKGITRVRNTRRLLVTPQPPPAALPRPQPRRCTVPTHPQTQHSHQQRFANQARALRKRGEKRPKKARKPPKQPPLKPILSREPSPARSPRRSPGPVPPHPLAAPPALLGLLRRAVLGDDLRAERPALPQPLGLIHPPRPQPPASAPAFARPRARPARLRRRLRAR